ncbi:TonB-dependent receptor domain-containing protein [Novosphingobium umbonatum]|nr:TonB-dependent receptor [Novosphingobium umbonatum]
MASHKGLLLGVSLCALTGIVDPAWGQEAPVKAAEAEIIVTGSRVIANGNNSPIPVTVVTMEALQATKPSSVFDALLDVPAFAGSRGGTQSSASGNQASSNQINALNLRGLGPVRTLLLYDGHRVPPTQLDGLVDANIVPQMLLSRVDVVTGGASAVYGSDAIGGVVNFITDRKFKGVKLEMQRGISQQGDAGTYRIGGAFGANLFDGRGHFMASFESLHNDGLLARQRPQFAGRWTVQGNGSQANPFTLVSNLVNPAYTWGGKITGPATNPLLNTSFNSNGVLSPFVAGAKLGSLASGGDGIWDTTPSLIPMTNQTQAYGRFDYDVSDALHGYVSAAWTQDRAFNLYGNVNSQNLTISATNAFLPSAYQMQLAAAGIKTFTFSKKYAQGLVPPSNVNNNTSNVLINIGLDGKIGGFKWDLGYVYNQVRLQTLSNYTFNNGRLAAALDAVVDPFSGKTVCNVTLTNPGLYPGCVPINVFGPSSESQAAVDYVGSRGEFITRLPSHDLGFNLAGSPFSTWAGPVQMALSTEWRKQSLSLTSTSPTIDFAPLNCTGLRYNCVTPTATNLGSPTYNGAVAPRPEVGMTVIEGALEANIPLLVDKPFADAVNLNLANRYARYRAEGNPDLSAPARVTRFNAYTWKAGLDWHVSKALTLRGTHSRDIRAPNLYELYQTNAVTFSNSNTDLLTNSNLTGAGGLVQVVNGGNVNLRPEVASTTTLGLVFKPSAKFSLALDYYHIKVSDYITRINGWDVASQNACYTGNAYFCSLQVRPGSLSDTSKANAVTRWYSVPVNVAALTTQGVDVEANFRSTLVSKPFSLRALVTYQPHIYFVQPGVNRQDFAGAVGAPASYTAGAKFRAAIFAHFEPSEQWALDWETKIRGQMHQSPDATLYATPNTDVPAVAFSNLTITAKLKGPLAGRAQMYLNISNLFNQSAPITANYADQGSPGLRGGFALGDDPVGRYFRMGARLRW